jgi:hypothetical protein
MGTAFRHSKGKIFRETLVVVLLILIVKVFINHFGWEFMTPSSLLPSIITSCIFVLGFILSGTYRDYKESEYIPVRVTAAIESIYQDGILFKKQYKKFNLIELEDILETTLALFRKDLTAHTKKSYFKILELSEIFAKLERLGVPANYIVKLKQDQSVLLRSILRVNYFQKIQPIPSAFVLVQAIVYGLIVLLLVTKLDSVVNELLAIGTISFIFVYMLKLIKVLDKPFHTAGSTMDDVSLFQLKELQTRIGNEK